MLDQDSLFSHDQALNEKLSGALISLGEKNERIDHLEDEVERLREIIRKFKKEVFGPRSERWESKEQLLLVFNEAEAEARRPDADDGDDDGATIQVAAHTKKRGKRKKLPEHLPREVVVVDLAPSEKVAPDGTPFVLRVVGKEISEKLEYQPASLKVIEVHRLKYEVVGSDGESHVRTAPPPPSIVPKGIATASLVAGIVVNKYADGLPLYRQEEIFKRHDIDLPRSTQGRWVVSSAKTCQPIWNILEEWLMAKPYVSCDETWTQVLKEAGRAAESDSWMWVRATPSEKEKIVLFDYDPHRSGAVAKRLFNEYRGFLQVDGFASYNCLEKQDGVIRIGCNMHGRRGFSDAVTVGAKSGQSLGEVALKFYHDLYEIEEKDKELSWDDRHRLRQDEAVPIWANFKQWAIGNHKKVPPKSKIGQAFHYFLGEYEYLTGYLKDGRLEIDNGFVERMIKYFAIGRNNWLFSDTEAGADASALFYSFVVTAKANGVNPYRALTRIFTEIPLAKTIEDFERLASYLLSPTHTA